MEDTEVGPMGQSDESRLDSESRLSCQNRSDSERQLDSENRLDNGNRSDNENRLNSENHLGSSELEAAGAEGYAGVVSASDIASHGDVYVIDEVLLRAPRIGVDLGAFETRIALPPELVVGDRELLSLPTVLSYSRQEAEPVRFSCIGDKAVLRRDHMRLVQPFRCGLEGRGSILRDFAQHLRALYEKRGMPTPWAVVNCSVGASEEVKALKRVIAGEIFERVLFVDDIFLLAVGLAAQEVAQHSVIVDIGSSAVRGALMHGETPSPEEYFEVPVGGARIDEALRRGLALRYPELLLTSWTLNQLKNQLSFISPARRRCELKIEYRGSEKVVDVTDIVYEASLSILRPLLKAVRELLARCPSDEIEAFQRNIILVGGGAGMRGLVERVEQELHADGFELARVRKPQDPTTLVARGALRWAQLLRDDQWSIPLFSFAE